MKIKDLEEKIRRLEARIAQLESRPPILYQYHYHYPQYPVQPYPIYQPQIWYRYGTGGNTAITTTGSSQ